MQYAIEEIIESFEQKTNIKCRLVIGSSGKLTAQLIRGAPYHIFLSADSKFPRKLLEEGIVQESPRPYAIGRLALWSTQMDTISIDALKNEDFQRLAIANPKTAPYGIAAIKFLKNASILDQIEDRLVYGESVGQVNQFVTTGVVSAGITAQSTIINNQTVQEHSWIAIDPSFHEPIIQQYVVLPASGDVALRINQFEQFLDSTECHKILVRWGYQIPS